MKYLKTHQNKRAGGLQGLWLVAACLLSASVAVAQQPPMPSVAQGAPAGQEVKPILPDGAIVPGYRKVADPVTITFNPFEPIREVKTDANSELAQSIIKRLKGYVVQSTGVPLLVIDGKSYKVGDKVSLSGGEAGTASKDKDSKDKKDAKKEATPKTAAAGAAASTSGDMATIISVSANEAVFRKEDGSGFGGETFKIYFNFSKIVDDKGDPAYVVWEPVATGFFVSEDGLAVVPLAAVRTGELSVQTQSGPRKATLVESDEKRGVGLIKVAYRSSPIYLSKEKPAQAEAVYPAAYPPTKEASLRFLEGFVKNVEGNKINLSPAVDGALVGAAILNKQGDVLGIAVGDTDTLPTAVILSATDSVFKKYPLPEKPKGMAPLKRSTIELSVVQVLKKR